MSICLPKSTKLNDTRYGPSTHATRPSASKQDEVIEGWGREHGRKVDKEGYKVRCSSYHFVALSVFIFFQKGHSFFCGLSQKNGKIGRGPVNDEPPENVETLV
jgi:hypothetical protein